MQRLLVFAFIGFLAQLIDGALGMAYGLTSSSLLLMFGIAPAVASASVHFAEVVTTAASGAAHIRFGNVDKHTVYRLIIPGSIGAFLGACFLSNLPGELVKPYISIFLLILGVYILFRFLFQSQASHGKGKPLTAKQLIPLGFLAGFVDSTGGGGWGPITTPVLLARKGSEARKVIGSVDTSEFPVALSATAGFLISLGWEQMNWFWVFSLMIGGVIAAPIAAWFVRIIPSYLLGIIVGSLIILSNARTLLNALHVNNSILFFTYGIILVITIGSAIWTIRKHSKKDVAL
ncbi:sulfite exporter TauE/SafE family protein [Bacillus sp. 165]|uniref:sulfite exporter TauE/SafE family protein n=1 Tax=Bacillus sp. 165 TaxID=1529117 RepID=UPI001AD9F651|nr:sulfite exporter TauE/SafE family protein [Bacillus sp. 165]MBO9129205.1 sulfite exporter TauE/SafE family protein [Bacillus sp. 165]